jgi:hypothetical protein
MISDIIKGKSILSANERKKYHKGNRRDHLKMQASNPIDGPEYNEVVNFNTIKASLDILYDV